jgi:hypothetical protein
MFSKSDDPVRCTTAQPLVVELLCLVSRQDTRPTLEWHYSAWITPLRPLALRNRKTTGRQPNDAKAK